MKSSGLLVVALLALGCGGSSSAAGGTDATGDGTTNEAGASADSTIDASGGDTDDSGHADARAVSGDASVAADVAADGGDTSIGTDAASGDGDTAIVEAATDVLAADGACKCQPYWCGCGTCDRAQIACTVDPPPCVRGCASSCLELGQVTCTCDQGRCMRGGVDASTIGCLQDQDCPPGDCCAHVSASSFCTKAPYLCCAGGGGLCP